MNRTRIPRPSAATPLAALLLVAVVLVAVGPTPAAARSKLESPNADLREVEAAVVAARLPEIAVQYRGLDISFAHYARYKVFDSTGKRSIGDEDPVFTYLSILFRPDRWVNTPLFPIDHPKLARLIGAPFKSRLRPRDLTPSLQGKLQAIVAFATAMPEERARMLIDLPPRSAGVLSRDQFAGIFMRTLHVESRMRQVRELGLKLDVELYRQWRAEYFPPSGKAPSTSWDLLSPETRRPLGVLYTNYLLGRVPHERLVNYMVVMLGNYADPTALQSLINDFASGGLPDHTTGQAAMRLFRRVTTYNSIGDDFKIVALPGSLSGEWISPFEAAQSSSPVAGVSTELLRALLLAFRDGDSSRLAPSTDAFLAAMTTVEGYTTPLRRRASHYYNTGHPFNTAMWFYLAGGVLFALGAWRRDDPAALPEAPSARASGPLYWGAAGLFVAGFAFHTLGIACRIAIMERAPVSNIWESIIWVTWGGVLFGGAMEWRYRTIFTGMITALTGFVVLLSVNALPDDMGQMQPLRAVLVSTWLTYHVLSITLSYAAFMLSAAFAIALLARDGTLLGWLPGGGAVTGGLARALPAEQTLELFVYRAIQIGYPLLTWGVFSGAVWADHAWGRFWAWDPKETWSLITWFVYTAFLHLRLRHGLAGSTLAWMSLAGFAAVLITWLGVSYLPIFAGLHSYANG